MYESPVTLIHSTIMAEREEYILTTIREAIGVAVDKEEPIKALKYDREQYEKGFKDGVKQQTKWISVSERLPKNSGNYLIAIADSNYTNGQYYNISWFYPSNKEWSYRNAAVIAWMPLPEPYKE